MAFSLTGTSLKAGGYIVTAFNAANPGAGALSGSMNAIASGVLKALSEDEAGFNILPTSGPAISGIVSGIVSSFVNASSGATVNYVEIDNGGGLSVAGSPITSSGAITLSVLYGTSSSTACRGSDSRLNDARVALPSSTVSGDVTGTLGTTQVIALRGIAISAASGASGSVLTLDDSTHASWQPQAGSGFKNEAHFTGDGTAGPYSLGFTVTGSMIPLVMYDGLGGLTSPTHYIISGSTITFTGTITGKVDIYV